MNYLFSYGTFQNPMIQEKLFHRQIPLLPAVLKNYGLFEGEDGYYQIEASPNEEVSGSILALSDTELAICDIWEEVGIPYYRELTYVSTPQGIKDAWVYYRSTPATAKIPVAETSFCSYSSEELMCEMEKFIIKNSVRLLPLWNRLSTKSSYSK